MSSRMVPTLASAIAARSIFPMPSADVPPLESSIADIRCAMTPRIGMTATAPPCVRDASCEPPPAPIRA